MALINIPGGMKSYDLLKEMARIIDQVEPNQEVIVLLDEINCTPHVWAIKEVVCDRFVLGRRIPDNLRVTVYAS